MSTVSHKPALLSTAPLSDGSRCLGTFVFDDGVTVKSNGGLVCSQHGRRHCSHHKEAHNAIVAHAAQASAAPAATATPARCWECGDPLRNDQGGHYCDWCAPIMDFLKTNAFQPSEPDPDPAPQVAYDTLGGQVVEVLVIPDIPLLMDVEAETARVTAQMEADGFFWNGETWARCWVHTLSALVDELLTEAAIEAAENYDADYDAWLDSLPPSLPTPDELQAHAPTPLAREVAGGR